MLFVFLLVMAFSSSGCLENIIPDITMGFDLSDIIVTDATNDFASASIDASGNAVWVQYAAKIKEYKSLRITATIVNTSGGTIPPNAIAGIKVFVGEAGLDETNVATQAQLLYTLDIPADATSAFDTGVVPISAEVANIISDGIFACYVLGPVGTIDIKFENPHADLTFKPQVLAS